MNPISRLVSSGVIVILILGSVFFYGYSYGKHLGELALDDFIARGKQLALENSLKFRELEKNHRDREQELVTLLSEERKKYDESIATINNDYANRLREHQKRTDHYRRLVESGHKPSSEFIAYTGELDKSLEEGIHLVKQLSETIRLLEYNIQTRDAIINNDRNIINDKK